jgi:hypothetical protein
MARSEQLELDAHREQMDADVGSLVEKYRAIFQWDVPEIDMALSERLIISAIRKSLDAVEQTLRASRQK